LTKLAIINAEVKTGLFCNSVYNLTRTRSWSRFYKVL